ncbi:MAG: hemopexin repeat-containing protein [Pseudomonadota bacterium]
MITKAYFIFGSRYARYDAARDQTDAGYPKSIADNWHGFLETGFTDGMDAALNWAGDKVFLFKGQHYLRYDIPANRVDTGYPLRIGEFWPGLAQHGFDAAIDAAVNWDNGKVYFFKGSQYLRYDVQSDRVDEGYPLPIAGNWPGLAEAGFADGIDTVINWGNGKAYFFRGDQFVRYDMASDTSDPGYPRNIDEDWPGLGSARTGGRIDASWTRNDVVIGSTDFSYLSDAFFLELKAVCDRLQCDPRDLLGVMESESGVQPWRRHPSGVATGLIQFMPETLSGLGWTDGREAFARLSAEEQLPFVERYYRPHVGQLSSAGRLYQATFLPATLPNSNEETVIAAPGGPHADAYRANLVLDTNGDRQITVSDLTARVQAVRSGPRWDALMQRLQR